MSFYLVTGGAGFIGSNLVHALVAKGHSVRVLDDFSTGRRANLSNISGQFELFEGDLRDLETCRRAVNGVDFVLHQGAVPSVPRSVSDPILSMETNANATLNILVAARDGGVRRVVYASSSSVYGDSPTLPKQESMAPRPKSPYAVAKLAAEQMCQLFFQLYGLETVCIRYFNVFGPRQDPASSYAAVIPLFIKAMLAGQAPTIQGNGEQSRDFTFIDNVLLANLLAATAPGVGGEVFNVACGQRHTLLDLVAFLNAILDTAIEPVHVDGRTGDVRHSLANIERAKQQLGYEIRVDFLTGLRKTVAWYQQERG